MNPHLRSVSPPVSPHDRVGAPFLTADVMVGLAAPNLDEVPHKGIFRAWCRTRLANVSWEGLSGLAYLESEDVPLAILST